MDNDNKVIEYEVNTNTVSFFCTSKKQLEVELKT